MPQTGKVLDCKLALASKSIEHIKSGSVGSTISCNSAKSEVPIPYYASPLQVPNAIHFRYRTVHSMSLTKHRCSLHLLLASQGGDSAGDGAAAHRGDHGTAWRQLEESKAQRYGGDWRPSGLLEEGAPCEGMRMKMALMKYCKI